MGRFLLFVLWCCNRHTLIHAFVTSRLDHCCPILVSLPLASSNCLSRPSLCCKCYWAHPKIPLSQLICMTLLWLPVAQHISYRIAVLLWRCLLGSTPAYLCPSIALLSGIWYIVLLLLAKFWFLMLFLQLSSIAHSPLSAPPPKMDAGLEAPLSNHNRNLQISRAALKSKRKVPAYSRALWWIKLVVQRVVHGKVRSDFHRVIGDRVAFKMGVV